MRIHLAPEASDHSQRLKEIMESEKRLWKNAPRVVVDHKNDKINIVCGDKKMWSNDVK